MKRKIMNEFSSQIRLLLWKHFQIQKRSPVGLLLKITIPALFAIILMPIRSAVKSNPYVNITTFKAFDLDSFDNNLPLFKNSTFAYCPNDSSLINDMMENVALNLALEHKCK